ncbi:MAG TPA: hypothetical protein VH442_13695, partial [Micromonosporaceae bacterium]
SANSGGTAAPSPTASGRAAGIQAYVTCLSQHGVTLPSRAPGAGRSGAPRPRPSFTGPRPSRSPGGGFGGGGFGGGFGGFGGFFANPSNPPAGVSAATWSAALSACKSLQPAAAGGGFNNSQFTAYRNCLQSHGVTFSGGANPPSTSDPKVAAALKTCAPLRPSAPPRGSNAPTPTPSASG